jgi:hypothetical protein
VGLALVLGLLLVSCTGRGGGWLPPATVFQAQATFGFSFRCERSSKSYNLNPPVGRLHIKLAYTDHGTNPLGDPFSIHGEADTLPPVVESAICIGQEPPPGGNELIFLGRYRPTSSSAGQFPAECDTTAAGTDTTPCRFEVTVRDNDGDYAPSTGDYFSIKLSTETEVTTEFDPAQVIYSRAGFLGGGDIQVD